MTIAPVIETERLVLRMPEAGDIGPWMRFHQSARANFVGGGDVAEEISWRMFAGVIGHWALRGFGLFIMALKDGGRAVGYCGPWRPHGWPEEELGWAVWDAADEGRGYVREGVEAARAHAFRDLGWKTAVSYIDARNTRSIRLAERLGAAPDWSAATPRGEPCVVFRHPAPEGIA